MVLDHAPIRRCQSVLVDSQLSANGNGSYLSAWLVGESQ